MLSPDDIRTLCRRKYPAFLRSMVTGEPFFPLKVPFGRPTSSEEWHKLDAEITALAKGSLGYRIEWEHINTRVYGRQQLPQRVWFDDESSFLKALGKQAEVDELRRLLGLTAERCPELTDWLPANVLRVIEHASIWPQLLLVCRYFIANPRPGRYARELPIAVDTKFIERHASILRNLLDFVLPLDARNDTPHFESRFGLRFEEPRIQLRILDPQLQRAMSLPVDDLSVPLSQTTSLAQKGITVLVIENKKTFLTLPRMRNALGIFGGGGAAELLTSVQWLSCCQLLYWGDLDVHGFHILSRLRRAFPSLVSVMMDLPTLRRFESDCGAGKPAAYEEVSHLTEAERAAYDVVRAKGLLLEQERIPYDYCVGQLGISVR
jgi:hypothetical protein